MPTADSPRPKDLIDQRELLKVLVAFRKGDLSQTDVRSRRRGRQKPQGRKGRKGGGVPLGGESALVSETEGPRHRPSS